MSALAFMAGLAKGGIDGYMLNKQDERRQKDDEWREEQRTWMRKDRERDDKLKDDLSAAGRSASMTEIAQPASMDNRDVGLPGEQQLGTVVNGSAPMDPNAAQQAAAQYNAPMARMTRVADVYDGAGQADKAFSIRSSLRQNEVADLQAKQLKESDELNTKLREVGGLIARGGWGSVPEVYARYNDGFDAQVIEDGKGGATVVTMKDGKEVERDVFADLPQLYAQVAGQFKPELWMADVKDRAAAAAAGRKEARDERKLDIAEQRAMTADRRAEALIKATVDRNKGDAAGSGVGLKDRRDFLGDVGALLPKPDPLAENVTELTQANQTALAQADAIFTVNAERGAVLTGPQAVQAMTLARDSKNVKVLQGSDGMAYETVNVNGTPVIVSAPMRPKPPQAAAPQQAAAPAGPSMTRVAAPAAPARAPAAPVDPLTLASEGDLARLAAIPGHVNQQRAAALLEDRKRAAAANNAEAAAAAGQGVNFPY